VKLNLAGLKGYHQTLIRLLRNHLLPKGEGIFSLVFYTDRAAPAAHSMRAGRLAVLDCALPRQLLILNPLRNGRINPQAALLVFLVILEIAFEPFHMAVAFEGEHMGGDAVQKEAIM
jgi:hypothetical protein